MPTTENDIYVDLTLMSESDWELVMPTIFSVGVSISGSEDLSVRVVMGTLSSGTLEMDVEAPMSPTNSGIIDVSTSYISASGTLYANDVFTELITVSDTGYYGADDVIDDFIISDTLYTEVSKVPVVYGAPNLFTYRDDDVSVNFKIYIGSVKYTNDVSVDVTLAASKYFWCDTDVFSTAQEVASIGGDVETDLGRVTGIHTDLVGCSTSISGIYSDLFSSALASNGYDTDVEIAPGTVRPIDLNVFSTASGVGNILCDTRTWSLYFGDFFLDVLEFTAASGTSAWVDIIDYSYPIDTSNSYFLVDGQQVSVTFSGISNGQRMFYDPPNDFYGVDTIAYTAHAQNTMGDVRDQSYYLLFGYDVRFKGYEDWGLENQIDMWTKATNVVLCPNTSTDGFYFSTTRPSFSDLGVSISPRGLVKDLGATICPQNPFFFYGKTYSITVSGVKDFQGNEMEPRIYTFTIEDPT